jgi:hypothetical protein
MPRQAMRRIESRAFYSRLQLPLPFYRDDGDDDGAFSGMMLSDRKGLRCGSYDTIFLQYED